MKGKHFVNVMITTKQKFKPIKMPNAKICSWGHKRVQKWSWRYNALIGCWNSQHAPTAANHTQGHGSLDYMVSVLFNFEYVLLLLWYTKRQLSCPKTTKTKWLSNQFLIIWHTIFIKLITRDNQIVKTLFTVNQPTLKLIFSWCRQNNNIVIKLLELPIKWNG